MRPVFRGNSPQAVDYDNYRDAFDELAGRIGMYCSYCERRIAANLAVEHIQPKKGPHARPDLVGRWDNFLLGCTNCNSTKGTNEVVLADLLLPDRDNTAAIYEYTMDGRIDIPVHLAANIQEMARKSLELVGLDRRPRDVVDLNALLVAKDRYEQRMQAWAMALESKADLQAHPSDGFRRQVARTAKENGFFSVWMTVFSDDIAVRKLLIAEFRGTAPDCFDADTQPVTPRPATALANGSKV